MDERELPLPAYTGAFLSIYYLGLGSFLSMETNSLGSFLSISYSYLGFPYWYDNQYRNPPLNH